ncbi:MAG: radical SAM family heme chaperone HemW [Ruminococcus sp.]|nr:radical SAM family heme chaperone HemW [Ruminococcus sp.]
MTGIYIHIPFCARKCPYCDFFSASYRKETAERYVGAVIRNLAAYASDETVDTVYFGGGTPSLLSAEQIGAILTACDEAFHLAKNAEITMECNPTGRRRDYLRAIRSAGVNRLSIGTQSFSDAQLTMLGRTHTAQDGIRTVMDACDAGFQNISCDLMLACPGQTEALLTETVRTLGTLPITHVSAYLLQVEAGTPLSQDAALLGQLPTEDAAADLYLHTVQRLAEAGFAQYEVSSFAKEGFRSRHNLKYWQCDPYLGIGAGAHSCYGGKRFQVPKDIEAFCMSPVQPTSLIDENPCGREERLMLSLRTTDGVPAEELPPAGVNKIPLLEKAGYLKNEHGRVHLTPSGFAVSNAVIAALLD